MPLANIPVVAVGPESDLSGNAPALLREVAERLRELLDSGHAAAIDLKGLPLTPGDLAWLRTRLGRGEVEATLHISGESTLAETACPGVWWVTHRNEGGAVVAELIEVNFVPEILQTHPDSVRGGLKSLEALIGP